jgi:hypothetical protein
MITNYQIKRYVHTVAIDALRLTAKDLKLDLRISPYAKQKDMAKVKKALEDMATWHALKIDLATEAESRRKARAAVQMPS